MTLCAEYIVQTSRSTWQCLTQAEYDALNQQTQPYDVAVGGILLVAACVLLVVLVSAVIRRIYRRRRDAK